MEKEKIKKLNEELSHKHGIEDPCPSFGVGYLESDKCCAHCWEDCESYHIACKQLTNGKEVSIEVKTETKTKTIRKEEKKMAKTNKKTKKSVKKDEKKKGVKTRIFVGDVGLCEFVRNSAAEGKTKEDIIKTLTEKKIKFSPSTVSIQYAKGKK
tara:strand:- start:42319 stop:42780 length:462 start_codon:yes stop_codon:yes gene_type:complete